jgi:hypothetical protein
MPDDPTTPDPSTEITDPPADPPADPVTDPTDPPADPPADPEPTDPPGGEEDSLDLDGAKAALSKVRKEAANWRTKHRDLEKKVAEAKTPEEVAAIVTEVKETAAAEARTLLVENVALAHGLPADLAEALKGETREELEAHAKKLQKYAPAPGADPELGGGLDPTTDPNGAYDPAQRAKEIRAQRRGF